MVILIEALSKRISKPVIHKLPGLKGHTFPFTWKNDI